MYTIKVKSKDKIKGGIMEELDLKELFNIFWNKKVQIILIVLIFTLIHFQSELFFKVRA